MVSILTRLKYGFVTVGTWLEGLGNRLTVDVYVFPTEQTQWWTSCQELLLREASSSCNRVFLVSMLLFRYYTLMYSVWELICFHSLEVWMDKAPNGDQMSDLATLFYRIAIKRFWGDKSRSWIPILISCGLLISV